MDCFLMMVSLFKILATPCGIWDLGSLTKDRIHIPCIGRQSLNHGATRGVPSHDGVNPPFPHDLWYWASHNMLVFCILPLAKCLCKYITHFLKFFFFNFLIAKFCKLLMYILHKPLARHVIFQYLLLICDMYFHSLNDIFQRVILKHFWQYLSL